MFSVIGTWSGLRLHIGTSGDRPIGNVGSDSIESTVLQRTSGNSDSNWVLGTAKSVL